MRRAPASLRLPLLVSLLGHAAALHFVTIPAAPTRPSPLEARLLPPPPPPPPKAAPLPPPPATRPEKTTAPRPARPPASASPTPVIALPGQPEAPASSFSVPAPPPELVPAPAQEAAPPPAPVAFEPPRYGPAYLDNPKPAYPAIARRRRLEDTVFLDVLVGADGRPMDVQLATSSGSAVLDEAALAAVRGWRFVPAKRGDEPVEARLRVPIRFRLVD